MSVWLAALVIVGLPLCAVAAGICLADLIGRRRRGFAVGGLAVSGLALVGLALAIPQFANDLRSAIVAVAETGPRAGDGGLAGQVLAAVGAALDWWRGLFGIEAWRSMGFILAPLAAVLLPWFLWRITKLHIHD
jgi:hypothetical protein